MDYNKDFSIIIPHRNSLRYLPQLFSTIPQSDKIEVILVDNSLDPIKKEDVKIAREYTLLYSEPKRGAGGARNVGVEKAHGKWLVFVDADDYLVDDAFDTFYRYFESDAEVVYFGMVGIYLDTKEFSDRGEFYTNLVKNYLGGRISENKLRVSFSSPCSKIVKHDLIRRYQIRFDECVASNDVFFSLLVGYYAKRVEAYDKIVYIATVSKGSLTKRKDYFVMRARFEVSLRRNKFLREHDLRQYQSSVMYYVHELLRIHLKYIFEILILLVRYRQNPFIGFCRWKNSFFQVLRRDKKDKKYITS